MAMLLRNICRAAMAVALGLGLLAVVPTGASGQASGFPSVGTNFNARGPFAVSTLAGSEHTYYYPSNISPTGLDHPVLLWGNGTGTAPSNYDGLLTHFASHGFIVAAANTPNAGSGTEMLAGLDNLTRFDTTSGHRFSQAVAENLVATTGHSQGGGGAMAAALDPRIDTTFPIEGGRTPAGLDDPILFLVGQNDTIARPDLLRPAYDAATAPAVYTEVAGATHLTPLGEGGFFRAAGVAWARWHLMGDQNARGWFVGTNCGLCNSAQMSTFERNARFLSAFPGGTTPTTTTPTTPSTSTTSTTAPRTECVTASNRSHVSAGRATSYWGFVYAVGSRDYLGRLSSSNSVSLQRTSTGWSEVSSC